MRGISETLVDICHSFLTSTTNYNLALLANVCRSWLVVADVG